MNQAIENFYPSWEQFKAAIPTGVPGLYAIRSDDKILVARRGGVWYRPRDVEAERACNAIAEHEAEERTRIGNTPSCDLCGEQHGASDCDEIPIGAMTEAEKQEYRLDQQDEPHPALIPEIPMVETIDLTPVGCQTPEGNARVNTAMRALDNATVEVANTAEQYIANGRELQGYRDLCKAIEERQDAQEAFLRAVAGR